MNKIALFEKVSLGQFGEGYSGADCESVYADIGLPRRATVGSAGYDFFAPYDFTLAPGETAKIPTGIRVKMEDGWVLMLFPRSGLGFKYRVQLDNTVGIIDGDYYDSDNEGQSEKELLEIATALDCTFNAHFTMNDTQENI